MNRIFTVILIFSSALAHTTLAQTQFGFTMPPKVNRVKISFEQYNNLIVVPVVLNNFLKLKFVLDTGVETPILTEEAFASVLGIEYIRELTISAPGIQDSIRAKLGQKVNFSMPGGIIGHNLNLLVLEEDYLKLSEKMGTEVYGIFGYDLFKQFVVEVNYDENFLILHRPESFKPRRRMHRLQLDIVGSKPYVSSILVQGSTKDTVTLMIDSGASHAVVLDVDQTNLQLPSKTIDTSLGTGIGGDILGQIGRIHNFQFIDYQFRDLIISIPEQGMYNLAIKRGSRQGTIGGEILSRLHLAFDYPNEVLYVAKGDKYKSQFDYDMSGISLATKGKFLDSLVVANVRNDSPAQAAGVEKGDFLLSVNGFSTFDVSLNDIYVLLKRRPNKKMKLRLLRNDEKIKKVFRLKRAI